jgi:hypothetical protein
MKKTTHYNTKPLFIEANHSQTVNTTCTHFWLMQDMGVQLNDGTQCTSTYKAEHVMFFRNSFRQGRTHEEIGWVSDY